MRYIATIRKNGKDIEVEFFENGNDNDARDKAREIAIVEGGLVIGVRKA